MCDPDCRKRFVAMEVELVTIATDIKWLKKIVSIFLICLAAFFGVDLTGVV